MPFFFFQQQSGGRVTVFQTCLPNVGPGALQSRENPNERSSKDIHHLGPATDFYKRLALECSGQQIAVDLFLLNSQYSDLASLCKCHRLSPQPSHRRFKSYVELSLTFRILQPCFQLASVNSAVVASITSRCSALRKSSKWSISKNASNAT